MFSMKVRWVKIFSSKDEMLHGLGKRLSMEIRANGKDLVLLKDNESFYLIKNKCPHQGLSMKDAKCENGKVICPFHQYRFSLENGRGHGLYLERYPIEYREDGVFAGFEYFSIF